TARTMMAWSMTGRFGEVKGEGDAPRGNAARLFHNRASRTACLTGSVLPRPRRLRSRLRSGLGSGLRSPFGQEAARFELADGAVEDDGGGRAPAVGAGVDHAHLGPEVERGGLAHVEDAAAFDPQHAVRDTPFPMGGPPIAKIAAPRRTPSAPAGRGPARTAR